MRVARVCEMAGVCVLRVCASRSASAETATPCWPALFRLFLSVSPASAQPGATSTLLPPLLLLPVPFGHAQGPISVLYVYINLHFKVVEEIVILIHDKQ